jgi:hypothetical protein
MVTATYEHIVIILLVGVIFVGTVVALPAINYSTFQAVDEQQLKNTALNVLNSLLLGAGSPANWGSNRDIEINEFGLALSNSFSKYILDSDKVQTLDNNNPDHLQPEEVRDLLNLQGYGFNITFYRPYTTIPLLHIDREKNEVNFGVTVIRTQDGTPIPNAEIKVTLFQSSLSGNINNTIGPYKTDPTGKFYGSTEIGEGILSVVAIMEITAGGMSTIVTEQDGYVNIDDFIQMNTSGDRITLYIRDEEELKQQYSIPRASREITGAWAYVSGILYELNIPDSGHVNFGSQLCEFESPGLGELGATALMIRLEVTIPKDRQRELGMPDDIVSAAKIPVYIVGALSFDSVEKILDFGFKPAANDIVVMMRRFVVISGMTYIVEIGLWKE